MRADRAGVSFLALPFLAVAVVGLSVCLVASYLLVRGPFLGGPRLAPLPVLYATGGFLLGLLLGTWGAVKAYRLS